MSKAERERREEFKGGISGVDDLAIAVRKLNYKETKSNNTNKYQRECKDDILDKFSNIEKTFLKRPTENSKQQYTYGVFACKCGEIFSRKIASVKCDSPICKKCSYFERARKINKHGDGKSKKRSKLYIAFHNIKARCDNKKNPKYKHYGQRGITNEFKNYNDFKDWALNNGYKNGLEIDRIDNDGNYSRDNCRWTTRKVQNRNTRLLSKNNTSGYRGVTKVKKREWRAQISVDRKNINLGTYNNKIEAAFAYDTYVRSNNMEQPTNFNKYQKIIKPHINGEVLIVADIYDVLKAFEVVNPATQHAIKKLLASGQRGYKDVKQDLQEARDSIMRAIELENE